jgi:hypothetical protein
MPIVLSQVNDYLGYMVTRWEFNNRTHYRQSMTLFGEDTANYVAGRFEGLARELRGQAPEVLEWDEPSELGVTLEDDIYATVSDLEPWVTSWASEIPADNAQQMGRILSDVEVVNDDEMGAQAVHFSWQGGTSDLPIPSVRVERQSSSGTWSLVMDDVHPHVWVLYEKGGKWEAVWHWKDAPEPGTYRIRVEGLYRGASDGTSTPDPLWDPSGRNVPYQVVSGDLAVQ